MYRTIEFGLEQIDNRDFNTTELQIDEETKVSVSRENSIQLVASFLENLPEDWTKASGPNYETLREEVRRYLKELMELIDPLTGF